MPTSRETPSSPSEIEACINIRRQKSRRWRASGVRDVVIVGRPSSLNVVSSATARRALSQHFVDAYCHARGQVQRANARRQYRHSNEAIAVSLMDLGGQTARFTAEHQDDIRALAERRVPEQPGGFGREEE